MAHLFEGAGSSPRETPALGAIADQLNELADLIRRPENRSIPVVVSNSRQNGHTRYLSTAHRLYQIRRRRAAIFGDEQLFGEPAWDMLLDLYIAYARGVPVSVTSACIGAAVPATTALRHLGQLHEHGLVIREHDTQDQRRVNVRLSEIGIKWMETYFDEIGSTSHGDPIQTTPVALAPVTYQLASDPKQPGPA